MRHEISETPESPKIVFDLQLGQLLIEGKSYAENVNDSFDELFSLLDDYCLNPQQKTTIEFKWIYYNTATARVIILIIDKLRKVSQIEVKWFCKKESFMMIRKGKELGEILNLEIGIMLYD